MQINRPCWFISLYLTGVIFFYFFFLLQNQEYWKNKSKNSEYDHGCSKAVLTQEKWEGKFRKIQGDISTSERRTVWTISNIHTDIGWTIRQSCCENMYSLTSLKQILTFSVKEHEGIRSSGDGIRATVTEVEGILSNTQNKPDTSQLLYFIVAGKYTCWWEGHQLPVDPAEGSQWRL